jgi:hypothetical protein
MVASGNDFPAPPVFVHRPLDAFPIEPLVIDKLAFRDDDGALQMIEILSCPPI